MKDNPADLKAELEKMRAFSAVCDEYLDLCHRGEWAEAYDLMQDEIYAGRVPSCNKGDVQASQGSIAWLAKGQRKERAKRERFAKIVQWAKSLGRVKA